MSLQTTFAVGLGCRKKAVFTPEINAFRDAEKGPKLCDDCAEVTAAALSERTHFRTHTVETVEAVPKGFTHRQAAFCREYLIDLNGTQAAIRAGYAPRSARVTASRMLTNANIHREIDALMRKRAERTGRSADQVIEELTRIAFASIADLVDFGPEGLKLKPPDQIDWGKISGVGRISWQKSDGRIITVRVGDKLRALELLGKHLGLFSGKDHENDAPPIINITVEKVKTPPQKQPY